VPGFLLISIWAVKEPSGSTRARRATDEERSDAVIPLAGNPPVLTEACSADNSVAGGYRPE
jgi:hypothetical protein